MSKIKTLETTNLIFDEIDVYEMNIEVKVTYGSGDYGPCLIPVSFAFYDKNNKIIKTYSTTFIQTRVAGFLSGMSTVFTYKVPERINGLHKIVATVTRSGAGGPEGSRYRFSFTSVITTAKLSYINSTSNKIKDDTFNVITTNPLIQKALILFE